MTLIDLCFHISAYEAPFNFSGYLIALHCLVINFVQAIRPLWRREAGFPVMCHEVSLSPDCRIFMDSCLRTEPPFFLESISLAGAVERYFTSLHEVFLLSTPSKYLTEWASTMAAGQYIWNSWNSTAHPLYRTLINFHHLTTRPL